MDDMYLVNVINVVQYNIIILHMNQMINSRITIFKNF